MNDFDDLWNDDVEVDLNSLDPTINIENRVKKASDAQPVNTNVSDDSVSSDWLDDKNWDSLDKPTQWRKLISVIENDIVSKYSKAKDTLEYKTNFLTNKLKAAEEIDSPEVQSLSAQLRELKQKYLKLKTEEEEDTAEVDFMKGRAAGFINTDNYFDFNDNPSAATKVLATGKYEYKPTERVFD